VIGIEFLMGVLVVPVIFLVYNVFLGANLLLPDLTTGLLCVCLAMLCAFLAAWVLVAASLAASTYSLG
jgi:hypothetical protein